MILIFDTHPIQYRSPVFASLHRAHPAIKVFFFADKFDGKKWWFNEVGKIPEQKWELALKTGFPNEVIGERKNLWQFLRRVSQLFQTLEPEAVVIYGYYLPEHWVLWWLCQWHRVRLVFIGETFTSGGSWPRRLVKAFLQPIFFRGVSRFVSIGEKSRDFYRSFQINDEKIIPGKYCVDTSFFDLSQSDSERARTRVRQTLKIGAGDFVVLFVGRLFERKRPADLISLAQALSPTKNIHIVAVGNGPLEESLRDKGRPFTNLHFVGFKNQSETREFYHAADVLIVPSEYETWGLVVNEAFTARVPALVTDTCGVANELVVPGKTGFVFPVGQWERAAREIRRLAANPDELRQFGENARTKVLGEYNIDQFATALMRACER